MIYDGDLSLPLGLALGSPIFPSGCEGTLGLALESLQGLRDDPRLAVSPSNTLDQPGLVPGTGGATLRVCCVTLGLLDTQCGNISK